MIDRLVDELVDRSVDWWIIGSDTKRILELMAKETIGGRKKIVRSLEIQCQALANGIQGPAPAKASVLLIQEAKFPSPTGSFAFLAHLWIKKSQDKYRPTAYLVSSSNAKIPNDITEFGYFSQLKTW